jgi:uncharacterized GH25 family protein
MNIDTSARLAPPSGSRSIFLIALLAAVFATAASAHDTWLLPDQFNLAPNETVTLQLTSGMAFPTLESGPKRERVQSANYRLAGATHDIADITAEPKALVFKTDLPSEGVATLWVKLPSRSIDLKPEEVEHYLDEIAAPPALRQQWAAMEPKRWRELYTKNQKTFVRVGGPEGDRSWADPVGSALEIVPESDPTALRVGDEFAVRVLKDGAPHPDFALNAVAAGETKGETRRTDKSGRVMFRLPKAGAWLLRGTDLRKSSRDDADWESDFVTLTINVRPPE